MTTVPPKQRIPFISPFARATLDTIVVKTLTAPFEFIKIRLQVQNQLLKTGNLVVAYRGFFDCFTRHSLLELFSGNLANIIRFVPTQFVNDTLGGYIKQLFRVEKENNNNWRLFSNVMSGFFISLISLSLVYPIDSARTILAVYPNRYSGINELFKYTVSTTGYSSLYRGFFVTCIGVISYRFLYYTLYDLCKHFSSSETDNSFSFSFIRGWITTIAAGLITYPLDTLRRRLSLDPEKLLYSGTLDCTVKIWQEEGFSGFFGGSIVNIFRAVVNATCLALMDHQFNTYTQ
eukprot:TRINITY_DN6251_c0_g1_i1.p1 TRINITY_DN6251_c0_g1~~TRINITY_DN6251_c0_g1_i1.p1  ORF type:complete len:290 (-),score=15.68 TRINITY_DN6251_c0_g1_i1:173-1042(-)